MKEIDDLLKLFPELDRKSLYIGLLEGVKMCVRRHTQNPLVMLNQLTDEITEAYRKFQNKGKST